MWLLLLAAAALLLALLTCAAATPVPSAAIYAFPSGLRIA